MGQKVHPEAMRVGYIHDWKSNWFNERHFAEYLAEDVKIREHITTNAWWPLDDDIAWSLDEDIAQQLLEGFTPSAS